jgi:hypothetical protein
MKTNQIRFFTLILLLFFSLYFVLSPYFFEKKGVIVNFVENEKCTLKENSIITEMKNTQIKGLEDFLEVEKNLKKGEYVSLIANGEPAFCIALEEGNLGIKASDIPSKKIKFSGEIQGWKEIAFSSKNESEIEKTKEVIEKRIKFFGIPSTSALIEKGLLKIRTIFPEEVFLLTERGKIEARIEQEIKLENGIGKILIGDDSYQLKIVDEEIEFNNVIYKTNESFLINDLKIFVKNITNTSLLIEMSVFQNTYLKQIGHGTISYLPAEKIYKVEIPVSVSEKASENFINVTKNLPAIPAPQPVLRGKLIYYLNGQKLAELSIPYEMKGRKLQTISIIFFAKNQGDALTLRKKVEAGLIGVLPELNFVSEKDLKPTYYQAIFYGNLIFWIALFSTIIILNRKNFLAGLKIAGLLFSCIFVLFGIASFSQQFLSYGWILDLPSFLGIFLFALTFIIKEAIKKKEENKILKYLEPILLVVGFCCLFLIRGFGFALFFGILVKFLLIDSLLKT